MSQMITNRGHGSTESPGVRTTVRTAQQCAVIWVTGSIVLLAAAAGVFWGVLGWITGPAFLVAGALVVAAGFIAEGDRKAGRGPGLGGGGEHELFGYYVGAALLVIGAAVYAVMHLPPASENELIDRFKRAGHKVTTVREVDGYQESQRALAAKFHARYELTQLGRRYETDTLCELMLDDNPPFIALFYGSDGKATAATVRIPGSVRRGSWVFLGTTQKTAQMIEKVL